MKKYIHYIIGCLLIALYACSDETEKKEDSNDNKVAVSIITEIQTKAVATTKFQDGSAINVYAKTYAKPDAPDIIENVKATYKDGSWNITPEIRLGEGEKAFIYAIAPYVEGLKDLTTIPVDIAKQQDILYSGNAIPVSFVTHQAKLTMKHALALATFNISNQGYNGKGILESISLSGDVVYTKGTMNIENGKIIGKEKEQFSVECNKQISLNGWTETLPNIWSIPFSTKASVAKLKVQIDGKIYEAIVPEVEMRGGFQYIFRLVLTAYSLEFIPDQTETISLNQITDQMEELKNHGVLRITHNTNNFILPVLNGDNVFGSIDWGDNTNSTYSIGASHIYNMDGKKTSTIESWNSTGFELKELTGIEVIDISHY